METNGYKAFWRGKSLDIFAESSYAAQKEAARQFGAKRGFEVTVILCETTRGEVVKHSTGEL